MGPGAVRLKFGKIHFFLFFGEPLKSRFGYRMFHPEHPGTLTTPQEGIEQVGPEDRPPTGIPSARRPLADRDSYGFLPPADRDS